MTDLFQNNIPNQKNTASFFTPPKRKALPDTKKVGQVSSILSITFGAIGMGILCLSLLLSLVFLAVDFIESPTALIIQLILLALFLNSVPQ